LPTKLRRVSKFRENRCRDGGESVWEKEEKQKSRVVARKLHDAADVLFGLMFADNIHYKFKSSQTSNFFESQASELQTYRRKTEFNAKWPFKIIQGCVFWSQWKGDKGLSNIK